MKPPGKGEPKGTILRQYVLFKLLGLKDLSKKKAAGPEVARAEMTASQPGTRVSPSEAAKSQVSPLISNYVMARCQRQRGYEGGQDDTVYLVEHAPNSVEETRRPRRALRSRGDCEGASEKDKPTRALWKEQQQQQQ